MEFFSVVPPIIEDDDDANIFDFQIQPPLNENLEGMGYYSVFSVTIQDEDTYKKLINRLISLYEKIEFSKFFKK